MKRAKDVLAHCPEGQPEAHRLPYMQIDFRFGGPESLNGGDYQALPGSGTLK